MNLLLEARKKALSAEAHHPSPADGLRPEAQSLSAADEARQKARETGQNLFGAKKSAVDHLHIHPYLLAALGTTLLLLVVGIAYWRNIDSATVPAPQRAIPPVAIQPIQVVSATEETQDTATPDAPVADEPAPEPDSPVARPEPPATPEPKALQQPRVRIAPQHREAVDPLLHDAYSAYRNGKLDEARQSYLSMLAKNSRNTDALLGLAAISQQRGESLAAAQYFARVLMLDPRNDVANAGMSTLNAEDEGNESRLKMLLREQGDSAALHFALGNLYAGQSRWGEAQQAYFNAWALDADNAKFAYNLAVSLDHLGQAELAVRHYRRAQQLDTAGGAGFDHAQVARRIEALDRPDR